MNGVPLPLLAATTSAGTAALWTFLVYTLAVFGLAGLSNYLMKSKSFLSEYFLGSRSLGVWAFAFTFAATSASGGSFTGFPSKIYTYGWVLALWIGSYMVVPICTMGLMGKRINQIARISGSITVPDVIRDRFHSAKFALLSVCLIVFFMSFNLVAQFKSGALILMTLLQDVGPFQASVEAFGQATAGWEFLKGVDSAYVLCLLTFGIAVIVYTTYGGFHAVVWTDVMQGIVMVIGVMVMLPLTLWAVGGLANATRDIAEMVPPVHRYATLQRDTADETFEYGEGTWLVDRSGTDRPRVFRTTEAVTFPEGTRTVHAVAVIELVSPEDVDRALDNGLAEPEESLRIVETTGDDVPRGTVNLEVQAASRPATVLQRGTLVSTSDGEDLYRLLRDVSIPEGDRRVTGVRVVEPDGEDAQKTAQSVVVTGGRTLAASEAFGYGQQGAYVSGPGPNPSSSTGFHPFSLAVSFFFMWAISGSGQPGYWVRLMAFNKSKTLRLSIFTVAMYYSAIYLPLVIIFCCARVLIPGMEAESDRIMPAMAVFITDNAGIGWLAGLLVAAPFAAVMSTVDSFLLVISSALVRDIYQRNVNPEAQEKTIKRLSYLFTLIVGTGAMLGAVNPPQFLQDIIVYTGSGLAACFLAPMAYALYWPRVNVQGATGGMLAGFAAHLSMYVAGIFVNGSFFNAWKPWNVDPILVGLVVSFVTVPIVAKLTPPPPEELVQRYFCK